MAPPPLEVQKAEELISESRSDSDSSTTDGTAVMTQRFQFVPSTAAKKDAMDLQLTYKDGDIPLFLADRLAFASNDGPQVCHTKYNHWCNYAFDL